MRKILTVFLALFLNIISFHSSAQLTLGMVDGGPYAPGSSLSATFSIGESSCIRIGNTFSLVLVNNAGNEITLGTYNGFYTTFVNGTIPANTPAGTGYKVRVKSSNPVLSTDLSAPFEIKAGMPVTAALSSVASTINTNPLTFGSCNSAAGTEFNFTNESTTDIATATVSNELNPGTPVTLTYSAATKLNTFTADQAHYTVFVKAASPDGIIGTQSYFLINNLAVTAFTTTSSNTVCFPVGSFEYGVEVNKITGIAANFPGNTYKIDWGDGKTDEYTICDIKANNNKVQHTFTKSSCGFTYTTGNQTNYNAFGINVGVYSPYCGAIGTPISTTARVVSRPVNKFDAPSVVCVGDRVIMSNQSTAGQNPNSSSTGCSDNNVLYTWYVDGVRVLTDVSFATPPPSPVFTTKGPHVIRMTSKSNGNCQADDAEKTICVQDPPKPSFTLGNPVICLTPGTLTPVNTSVLDNTCPNAGPVYTWAVTPATGVTFDANTATPQFKFTQTGVYNLTLAVQSGTCTVTSAPQKIVVNTQPEATLSPDVTLCATGNYTFNPTAGPTQTTLNGTAEEPSGTYTWTVTSTGNYTFISPDGPNTKYPTLNFADYAVYTVTLTHTNNCGTITKAQKITLSKSPKPEITAAANPVCYNSAISLTGNIIDNNPNTTFEWVSNGGVFSAPDNLITTYTPTAAERNAGAAMVILRVKTGLPAPCASVEANISVQIYPNNTGTNTTQNICSGQAAFHTPASIVTGSTFTWTAANADGMATGFSATGSGPVNQVITNTNATANAVVIYTVTPKSNGCDGVPYTFTVTITPIPVVTATAAQPTICGNEAAGITLNSTIANTKYTWTSTATAGITGNTNQAIPIAVTAIQDILVNSGATQGTVTYTITPVSTTSCQGTPVTITVKVDAAITIASAGPAQILCAKLSTSMAGNTPKTGETGQWSVVSGTLVIADPSNPLTQITGLTPGQTYVLKWTIAGAANCTPTTAEVTITNLPAVSNTISSSSAEVCYGQTIDITGDTPTGGNGTYTYLWESSTDNGATWNVISGQTSKDLNFKLLSTLSFRRTVTSGPCPMLSNVIQIIAQPPIGNNTITADQTICTGLIPAALTGSTPTGSDGHFNYQWQSSPDNTVWTDISAAVFSGYIPQALTATTFYRRVVSTQACNGALQSISPSVKITVKPNAKAEYTFTADNGCIPFVLNITAITYPDRNASYTWYADDLQIGTGSNFPGYTMKLSNSTVVIKLVVTSSLGCTQDEFSHTFSTIENVVPAFTQSAKEGCGPLKVNFINTSTSLTNATFFWDFGNGVTTTQVMPGQVTFQPDPLGKDTTYKVALTATTSCGKVTVVSGVFVKARPISLFSPDQTVGCSPMKVTFSNTSPGGTNTYYFDFGDGTLLTKTDKSPVTHTYTTGAVKEYVVKMAAQNECGREETSYTIRVSPNTILPELVVNADEKEGCAPLKVNFYNNSKGASSFQYDFGDGTTLITRSAPEVVAHTFTSSGTFTVKLTASNGCSDTTTTETIKVLPQPAVAFNGDILSGCPGLAVQFKNTSSGGISYLWDFGDGTTSSEFQPEHTFGGSKEFYTVTLKATNSLGCSNVSALTDYIHIVPPPVSQFNVSPSTVISIPDYTFRFEDESTGSPAVWFWDFGDKQTSILKSPSHTYLDTGTYVVTLRVTNQQGCFATTFKKVSVVGVPGYLFLPNSFMPGSETPELRIYKAKGSGIKNWRMSIFNKWGQDLWETTLLDDGRPAEGWDGLFKGSPAPQGVYFWKIDVEFINGMEWKGMTYDSSAPKRTGIIHLIR
ncbi:PKD domain-containing protein [Pedobacter cryoconitis]|uniref:PKD repeat protein n=1 Tax=Pedobacter cryoconitis TaxID=188932 RepID=A0A327RYZ5_9SPHI|nr:PKD domain-containing protein [Pedobacter cryoconitis]RAJ21999.1 PKD repeat protein [Pedobacter cryoconitis]